MNKCNQPISFITSLGSSCSSKFRNDDPETIALAATGTSIIRSPLMLCSSGRPRPVDQRGGEEERRRGRLEYHQLNDERGGSSQSRGDNDGSESSAEWCDDMVSELLLINKLGGLVTCREEEALKRCM